ncbi:MAG: ribose-5-phosphate isomerase, partial [Staphylococcus capitis]
FFLKRKIDKDSIDEANIKTLYSEKLIGISIPIK